MALSGNELNKLIDKIRTKYDDYAFRYSPKYFDRNAFEDRLQMALRNRMDIEAFMLAEVSNFEQIKNKYDEKAAKGSVSRKIDQMIEDQLARIKIYPKMEFHPKAGIEITHFYGALHDFAECFLPALWIITRDSEMRSALSRMEAELNPFAVSRGTVPAKRLEDHAMILSRKGVRELEIEKHRNHLLKDAAFVLHDIVDFCDDLVSSNDPSLEQPVRFDKFFQSASRRKAVTAEFSGTTGYGAALRIRDKAQAVIDDFRLTAFRRKGE